MTSCAWRTGCSRGRRDRHHPHFLGAVVLQQVQKQTGQMQERTIIDGQQRLTTLQLLLDALHAELLAVDALQPAMRIEPLVTNAEPSARSPRTGSRSGRPTAIVLPSTRSWAPSRPSTTTPSATAANAWWRRIASSASRHASGCCSTAPKRFSARAAAIETVVRELLQIVVIDLAADENAQEIFETLNARGAQLTAADLIKNFVFQRLLETGTNVEDAYQEQLEGVRDRLLGNGDQRRPASLSTIRRSSSTTG